MINRKSPPCPGLQVSFKFVSFALILKPEDIFVFPWVVAGGVFAVALAVGLEVMLM
jgi:hypothetical protein